MTDHPEVDPLKALKEYVTSLPQEEQDKALGDPHELFEMIERGDAVGVFIAVKNGADVEITDENGMTPLHHAAANDMPVIAASLNQEPNQAMWMKDKFERVATDLSSGDHSILSHEISLLNTNDTKSKEMKAAKHR